MIRYVLTIPQFIASKIVAKWPGVLAKSEAMQKNETLLDRDAAPRH